MSQPDRRPNWVRTVTDRMTSRPPLPPEANPFTDAQQQWADLRAYAAECADALRVADEAGRALQLENDSLRREVDHVRVYMGDQVEALTRQLRLVQAYATNLRTRLVVIRESIDHAESESRQFAANEIREREPTTGSVADDHEVREVMASIHRVNDPARRTMPPTNQFPAA